MTTATTPMFFSAQEKAGIMTISPEVAENWLKFNTNNRLITEKPRKAMAEAFKSGRFQFNGDPIPEPK